MKELFDKHQHDDRVHSFTCGNEGSHRPLKYSEYNDIVYCLDCDYIQSFQSIEKKLKLYQRCDNDELSKQERNLWK